MNIDSAALVHAVGDAVVVCDASGAIVVWNPGADKCAALADMPPDGWQHMVCVEAARIHAPVCLAPAQAWCGTQQLRSIATAA